VASSFAIRGWDAGRARDKTASEKCFRWNIAMKVVESELNGCGYCRVEYDEHHGDSSTLSIEIDNSGATGEELKSLTIYGSIEIAEFFNLIDRVRV
jgi:hypothetical protein